MGLGTIDGKTFQEECEGELLRFVADHGGADPDAL